MRLVARCLLYLLTAAQRIRAVRLVGHVLDRKRFTNSLFLSPCVPSEGRVLTSLFPVPQFDAAYEVVKAEVWRLYPDLDKSDLLTPSGSGFVGFKVYQSCLPQSTHAAIAGELNYRGGQRFLVSSEPMRVSGFKITPFGISP